VESVIKVAPYLLPLLVEVLKEQAVSVSSTQTLSDADRTMPPPKHVDF
jgi:hypothetical protein